MARSPILETLADMKVKLELAIETRRDADKQISEYSSAIRALALVCEDDSLKADYLNLLEELGGKPGFMSAIRTVLRFHRGEMLTPGVIRAGIQIGKVMDLTGYTNPLASIHTTLRRMKDNGEVEESINERGEKVYGLKAKTYGAPDSLATQISDGRLGQTAPPPAPPKRKIRPL